MPQRWLPILCAAMLAASCGSSSGSKSASSAGTATTTATAPTIDSSALKRLPQAPEPSDSRAIEEGPNHDAFLRAVFDDAEALWQRSSKRPVRRTARPG